MDKFFNELIKLNMEYNKVMYPMYGNTTGKKEKFAQDRLDKLLNNNKGNKKCLTGILSAMKY